MHNNSNGLVGKSPDNSITDLDATEEGELRTNTAPFSRAHTSIEKVVDDLTQGLKCVFPTSPRRYDNVHVLLVRWEEDDLGTETEIEELDKLFRGTYNYTTECKLIPSENSQNHLEYMITDFRHRCESPKNLLILYYGGHGVKDPENKSVWAATKTSIDQRLNWSDIQPSMLRSQSDVLFLLDCCYASSAGTREVLHGAKEVLAACSMEDVTTGVHDNSFTRNLIEELRDGAENGLTTWKLNGRMMYRRGRNQLEFTPRHFPLLNTNTPSIELCPLRGSSRLHPEGHLHGEPGNLSNKLTTPSLTEMSTVSTEDEDIFFRGRILLSINLSDWTIPPTSAEWLEWLRVRAPRNIESVSARFQRSGGQGDINRTAVQPQDPLKWVGGLTSLPEHGRSQRLEEALVLTESLFDSHSTLLLISVPLALWTFTPDNPAYSFVGFITSKNRVTGRELSRSNSMSELTKVAAEIDRQHWWYKWYLGLAIFTVFPAFWQVLPQRGAESLLSFFLLLGGVMATSFGLLTLADSSVTPLMNGSLSESSRQGAIY